jgi:hypothetical protein
MLVDGLGDILGIKLRKMLCCYWPRWDKLLWCTLRNIEVGINWLGLLW